MPIDEERTQPQGRKPGQAKILPSDDMKRVEKEFVTTRRAVKDINVKPMVLSVLGAKTGGWGNDGCVQLSVITCTRKI